VRLLLDTHAFLWWLADSPRLGAEARKVIADPDARVWLSAASAWEIAIKALLGRLDLGEPPEVVVPRELKRNAFNALAVTVPHALAVRALPPYHRDPFDRLLIAQAQMEQLALVTSEPDIGKYDVAIVPADR
jgi:PIN domain nuclease of toxin-antitoxin system